MVINRRPFRRNVELFPGRFTSSAELADKQRSGRAHRQIADIAKRLSLSTEPFALFDAWQFPTLTWGSPTLPSALRRFTSEFGMGSGGTTALSPPGKFCFNQPASCSRTPPVNPIFEQAKILSLHRNSFGVVRLSLTDH